MDIKEEMTSLFMQIEDLICEAESTDELTEYKKAFESEVEKARLYFSQVLEEMASIQ